MWHPNRRQWRIIEIVIVSVVEVLGVGVLPMSHCIGAVRFDSDGLVLWCEYNGATGVTLPRLWPTAQEVWDHWREPATNDMICSCEKDEPVEIAHTCRTGGWWKGRACRRCRVITTNLAPRDYGDEQPGLPRWYRMLRGDT